MRSFAFDSAIYKRGSVMYALPRSKFEGGSETSGRSGELDQNLVGLIRPYSDLERSLEFRFEVARLRAVKNWSRVLSYFRPEMPGIWLALLLMALSIGANLLKPWPVALILDHIVAGQD